MHEKHYPPELIFNIDETMLSAEGGKTPRVVCKCDRQPVVVRATKNLEHITIVVVCVVDMHALMTHQAISAAAELIQPVPFISPSKEAPSLDNVQLLRFYAYSGEASGWITSHIFLQIVEKVWFCVLCLSDFVQILLPAVAQIRARNGGELADRPAVIFCDGHSSHETPAVMALCRDNNVDVIKLYPHSSHITQPLDLSFFRKWRAELRHVCAPLFSLIFTHIPELS